MDAITFEDIWVKYTIEFREANRAYTEELWGLSGVNLRVGSGECVAVIGENGSGKTTLLKAAAGILIPDQGRLKTSGKVIALIDIGAAFEKEATGKENVYFTSALFGLKDKETAARFAEIEKFAGLGRFINAPIKCYSQGMIMRLAFAVAAHIGPDILLVDDIFSVGDLAFQRKCEDRMFELKKSGRTILFVSHDMEQAKRFCDRAVFLRQGRVIKDGPIEEAISYYLRTVGDKKGVGVLQAGSLEAVFNNGTLSLVNKNQALTKKRGGHLLLRCAGKWYSSLEADWEVLEKDERRLFAWGRFWNLSVAVGWELRVNDSGTEIDSIVSISPQEDCSLEEVIHSFMFVPEYNHWFDGSNKKHPLPEDLSAETIWTRANQSLLGADFLGLSAREGEARLLPVIAIQDNLYLAGKELEIFNTDRNFCARALNSRLIFKDYGFPLSPQEKNILFHCRLYIAARPLPPSRSIHSGSGLSLSIDDANNLDLHWRGKRVTSSKGFKCEIHTAGGGAFHSSDGLWRIHKTDASRFEIVITWEGASFSMSWDIELSAQGALFWRVDLAVEEELYLKWACFKFMFSPGFREWFTSREQGHIEEESLVKNLNSLMMNNDPFGIIGLKGAEGVVSILAQDKSQSRLFNFVRSEIDMNARAGGGADKVSNICFINSRPGGPAGFRKGVYRMGEFCLLASDDFAQMQEYVDNALLKASSENKRVSIPPKIELTDGRRILAFERGKGRLFISGSEVTGGWGLYTSIFSPDYGNNGFWHSSCDAIWEQVRLKKNRLLVKGNWPYLPITQLWEFILSPEGIIWRIDMQVHSRVRISRRQAKLMLLGEFVRWRCGRGKAAGVFPEGHPPSSWEMLYKDADNLCVGAENNCSGVEFAFLAGKENVFFSVIENSNALFKSRVIGFENAAASCEGEIIEPGVYNYFEGRVSF